MCWSGWDRRQEGSVEVIFMNSVLKQQRHLSLKRSLNSSTEYTKQSQMLKYCVFSGAEISTEVTIDPVYRPCAFKDFVAAFSIAKPALVDQPEVLKTQFLFFFQKHCFS